MLKWVTAVSTAAIAATIAFTAPATAADKVTLMLNWYVYGEHAPFYYGKAKGIFAAEGIDLDIQEGRGSANTVQAVAAKTVNFGYADVPTMMRAAVKGAPVIATGVLLQTTAMSAMGFVDKNIKKAEDLKGKTVAVTPADALSQIWPLFLKKAGLKEDARASSQAPMNLFWFAHHAAMTTSLSLLPTVPSLSYGKAESLDLQLTEFILRGIGLNDDAIASHIHRALPPELMPAHATTTESA